MQPIIEVKNISKKYHLGRYEPYQTLRDSVARVVNPVNIFKKIKQTGKPVDKNEFWALSDVTFTVNEGEVIGVIGKNGAGKSTLLKILSRITPPTGGEVRIKGKVASMLEVGTGFSPELTGRENIFLNGAVLGMSKREIKSKLNEIVAFSEIDKFIDTPVKYYSSGMYVRLAFSIAAHLEPDILLVDEVLAVGDAEFQKKSLEKMESITQKEGRTILFVSHNLLNIQRLCKKTILLDHGKIKMIGETKDVINMYLNNHSSEKKELSKEILLKPKDNEGNIRFTSIKISNTDGSLIINSGDRLRITLKYSSDYKLPIFDVRIVVLIISELSGQTEACLDSDVTAQTFDGGIKPNGQIICETGEINLIEGRYFVNINFHIQGTSVDNVNRAGEFEVRTDIKKYKYKIDPDKSVCDNLVRYSFK